MSTSSLRVFTELEPVCKQGKGGNEPGSQNLFSENLKVAAVSCTLFITLM